MPTVERLVTGDTLLILIGPDSGSDRENADLGRLLEERAAVRARVGLELDVRHAGSDDRLIDWIATEGARAAALIVNLAGCRTPFDIDALLDSPQTPVIEIRPDNPFTDDAEPPEPLRRAEGPIGMVYGLGVQGYLLAVNAVAERIARAAS